MTTHGPRQNFSSGRPTEERGAYSRAVAMGPHLYVAGTTATDEQGNIIGVGDMEAQARQTFRNIQQVVERAGFRMEDIVRARIYVVDMARWQEVAKVQREVFAHIRPVATLVGVTALVHPDMLVEVEVEALKAA